MICNNFARVDNRIIVVHQKHRGLADARNTGLERANGKYIAFIDGDDYVQLDMIECLYNALKEHDAQMAMCGRYIVDTDGKIIKTMFTQNHVIVYSSWEGINHLLRFDSCDMAVWDKLYERSFLIAIIPVPRSGSMRTGPDAQQGADSPRTKGVMSEADKKEL